MSKLLVVVSSFVILSPFVLGFCPIELPVYFGCTLAQGVFSLFRILKRKNLKNF
jgi:hypothetical protein